MTKHQRIIFNGNGYSEEWVKEAARRGLPNLKSMVDATSTLTTEKSIRLFEKFGIFTKAELESREEILYETYSKTINIEASTMIDMMKKQILPAVFKYTKRLADTVIAVKEAGADASVQADILNQISAKLADAKRELTALEEKAARGKKVFHDLQNGTNKDAELKSQKELAFYYKDAVHVDMDNLRVAVDALELLVDKDVWPMPTYAELLFEI